MELATFCSEPDFIRKAHVFYKAEWDLAEPASYGEHVLATFTNCFPCTPTDVAECRLASLCLRRALAHRRMLSLDREA